MSPRKRLRTSTAGSSSPSTTGGQTTPSQTTNTSTTSQADTAEAAPSPAPSQPSSMLTPEQQQRIKQIRKSRSWYNSWPRAPKSSASTQVARETILGGTTRPERPPNLDRFDTRRSSETSSLYAADAAPPESLALSLVLEEGDTAKEADHTSATKLTSDAPSKQSQVDDNSAPDPQRITSDGAKTDSPLPELQRPEQPLSTDVAQRPATASGWLGWFQKPPPAQPVLTAPEPAAPAELVKSPEPQTALPPPEESSPAPPPAAVPAAEEKADASRGSWFPFWGAAAPAPVPSTKDAGGDEPMNVDGAHEAPKPTQDVVMEDAPPLAPTAPEPLQSPSAGSTWAFWSRDSGSKAKDQAATTSQGPSGELAVIGEGSEAHPQPARGVEVSEAPASSKASSVKDGQTKEPPGKVDKTKKSKRLRPQSMDDESLSSRPGTPKVDVAVKADLGKSQPSASKTEAPAKTEPSNLLLPSFKSTYHLKENPSIIRQIAELLHITQQPPANHVFLTKEQPKIKKALAIGVHGLFPATYLRPMIGQPTGTSIKFANHCAEAIRRWADSHGCEDCEIEKVALEGEGKIADRVENLWKLLLNWIDAIRSADLIILACHSQGVPVGVMLVAKLIELGVINTPRIGVCAMAGVSLGPFPDYKSGLLMGSAAELWEFANPESEMSKRYEHSLKAALDYGVRLTYVGSIDDQVVPMESAVYSTATHPYIYRAVFIDGRLHAPDFIAHLVGFACKLRNLGISDHGLIRELSIPLAGSLYSGEGHSRLYDDNQVYDLAVSHALETSNAGAGAVCTIHKHEGLANPNPYHLPWIMRGLLEEDFVKTDLTSETAELLRQFDDWKPVTKALKDVKYRLEAVRSKL